jgi:uncharacterized protein (TIGR00369 family)
VSTYPPDQHVMRDLRIATIRPSIDRSISVAPLTAEVRNSAGHAALGLLVTLADVNGAGVALPAAHPDWIATADLSLSQIRPVIEGPVISRATLVRAGSKVIVVAVDVFDGHGSEDPERAEHACSGLMTFARIPRRATAAVVDTATPLLNVRQTMATEDSHLSGPLLDSIGLRVLDARDGVVELDRTDYVRNSFGTMNGGVLGMIFQGATEVALEARGRPFTASDIHIHYLAQCKVGPARTSTRVLRLGADHAVCEVRIIDAGNDDLLLTLATVTLTSA